MPRSLLVQARHAWMIGMVAGLVSASSQAPAQQPDPAANSKVEISTFEGWTVTCRIPEKAGTPRACSAVLRIFQTDPSSQQSRAIFGWVIGMRDKKPVGVFQLPTGVLIQPGVSVQIGKDTKTMPYSQCAPMGCEAVVAMDDGFNKAVSAAQSIDATIVSTDGKALKFTINTKGFARALSEIQK